MKKTIVILFISLLMSFSSSCQIPMGKDIKVGIKEIKLLMKNSGYTFYMEAQNYLKNIETGKYDVPSSYIIRYKEEIQISLEKNDFDNINLIVIDCNDQTTEKELLNKIGQPNWEYLYSKSGGWENKQKWYYYKIGNYFLIYSTDNSTINFARSIPPPNK